MIASREYVIKTMVSLLANPKKKYSQNFLTDFETVKKSCLALNDVKTIIDGKSRDAAGPTAPPQGLSLFDVEY